MVCLDSSAPIHRRSDFLLDQLRWGPNTLPHLFILPVRSIKHISTIQNSCISTYCRAIAARVWFTLLQFRRLFSCIWAGSKQCSVRTQDRSSIQPRALAQCCSSPRLLQTVLDSKVSSSVKSNLSPISLENAFRRICLLKVPDPSGR